MNKHLEHLTTEKINDEPVTITKVQETVTLEEVHRELEIIKKELKKYYGPISYRELCTQITYMQNSLQAKAKDRV